MEKLFWVILISSTILVTACSAPPYKSFAGQNTAQISFTSYSDNFPDLELRLRGKSYSIDRSKIKLAKADARAQQVFQIPANEKIGLVYKTAEITPAGSHPVFKQHVAHIPVDTSRSTPSVGHQIDFETLYKTNFCSTDLAFVSEKNKKYHVIIEQADGVICKISVREATGYHDD